MEPVIRDAAPAPLAHVGAEAVEQMHRAGNVGVYDPLDGIGLLIEEGISQPGPGIGKERVDGPAGPLRAFMNGRHALPRGEIDLQRGDLDVQASQVLGCRVDRPSVRNDQ